MEKDDAQLLQKIQQLKDGIGTVFVGNVNAVHNLLIGFLSGLNVLIEDIPGVGKTTLAKTLAKCAALDFARIQFTPDLLPGDIIGMTVWSIEKREFVFKPGAIMHQFILADEVNRASARTQSSLLEAMQEHSVTVDGVTYPLPEPFFVIATQNPVSFTGTFPLPEAQVDRFGVSFSIGYPGERDETGILERFRELDPLGALAPVIRPEEISDLRARVRSVFVDKKINDFIVAIARKTRSSLKVRLGMSPRASQHLLLAAQTQAFLDGRAFVIPEDVAAVSEVVIPHRILLKAEARMENLSAQEIVRELVAGVKMPTGIGP
jgi:MoxR-like ATPase